MEKLKEHWSRRAVPSPIKKSLSGDSDKKPGVLRRFVGLFPKKGELSLKEISGIVLVSVLVSGVAAYTFFDSFLVFILMAPAMGILSMRIYCKRRSEKREDALKKQFLSAIRMIGNLMRSGYSIESAIP